jgi:hypothetical protein
MRSVEGAPDISDRCALCQVKLAYHGPAIDGGPSEEVVRVIKKRLLEVDPGHPFMRDAV